MIACHCLHLSHTHSRTFPLSESTSATSEIGVIGLAVMGQNLALNIADKGFPVSVYNRSYEKTELAQQRAGKEGLGSSFSGYKDLGDFVASLQRPRCVGEWGMYVMWGFWWNVLWDCGMYVLTWCLGYVMGQSAV